MVKLRVHALAKEIGITTKELLKYFEKGAPKLKSNLSVVSEDIAEEVRAKFSGQGDISKVRAKVRKKPKPKGDFKVRRKKKEVPVVEEVEEAPPALIEAGEEIKPKAVRKTKKKTVAAPPEEAAEAAVPVLEETPEVPETPPVTSPAVQEAPPEGKPAAEAVPEKPKLKKKEKKKGKKAEAKELPESEDDSARPAAGGKGKKGRVSIRAEKIERPARKQKKLLPSQLQELQVRRTPKKLRVKPRKKTKAEKVKVVKEPVEEVEEKTNVIRWDETTSVKDVSERLNIPVNSMILKFMELGSMVTVNQPVDVDTLSLIADEHGYEVEKVSLETDETLLEEIQDNPKNLVTRPPVVTIMGHVDHGKTSLLDVIREANVVGGEAGGITQHIGAYMVQSGDRKITFLDTPGHESFTSMRARGAKVTDIVVLVVAADDGVMPQTVEAIHHATAANVPIVVAVNKIDKPDAQPDRVKQQLSEHNLMPEDWGGKTIFVDVSAKQKTGIDHLLEMILLQAEIMELKADPDRLAQGVIVEARLDKSRGPVATVLIQTGSIKVGAPFVSGAYAGKVRAMQNSFGKKLLVAGPSMPVELIGLEGVPKAGDTFIALVDERKARQVALIRSARMREATLNKGQRVTLDDLFQQIQTGIVKELPIIIKGDVQGSVEALSDTLERLSTSAVELKVIHGSVGGITETDVNLAAASNAIIIGFNVRPEPKAAALAENEQVDVRLYNVIYDASQDVRKAMEGLLEPLLKERVLGRAEIREIFSVSRIGNIAGCYVLDGMLERSAQVRLIRDNVVVYEGKLASLKRFKDDVKEVAAGFECGIDIENFNDIKVKDIIEFYKIDKVAAKL